MKAFSFVIIVNVAVVRKVVFLAGASFGKRGKRNDVGGGVRRASKQRAVKKMSVCLQVSVFSIEKMEFGVCKKGEGLEYCRDGGSSRRK